MFYDPAANDNLVSQNKVSGNGTSPPPGAPFPPVDLLYAQFEPGACGNCFEKNMPDGYTYFSTEPVPVRRPAVRVRAAAHRRVQEALTPATSV